MIYKSHYRHMQSGFTLLEILVVMTIIGMAAVALIIAHVGSGESAFIQAQQREMVAVLRYARRSAIVEGKEKVATFYQGKINEDEDEDEAEAADNSTKKTKKAAPGQWVSRGATLQWGGEVSDKDEAVYKITFYPEGGSSGGELILNYQDYKAKISVNPITGKIESEILYDESN